MLHQHGDGHWAHSTRHRRDGSGHLFDRVEVDVAHETLARFFAGVSDFVDTNVDDDGAGLDHVRGHEMRLADRYHENIGGPRQGRHIARA